MKPRFPSAVLFLALGLAAAFPAHAALWVSPEGDDSNPGSEEAPLRTITRARDLVRTLNRDMSDDITVFISGEHRLESPIVLGAEDSGSNGFNVVYTAAPGEHPVISGGYHVPGWSLADKGRNLWSAPAPAGLSTTFVLYVNGTLASRTRGRLLQFFTKNATDDAAAPDPTAQWKNPADVVFQRPGAGSIWSEKSPGAPPYVENAYELLGMPGEWYLDRPAHRLYYTPRVGEEISTADVVAPSAGVLWVGEGSREHPLTGIIIKGIRFEYTTVPSPLDASPDGSAARPPPPPAVSFSQASGIQFLEDEFLHMSTPALCIGPGSTGCVVDGCAFAQISWSALRIDQAAGIRVTENRFTYVATEHHGAGAITVERSGDVTVENNQIDHYPDLALVDRGNAAGGLHVASNLILRPMVGYHGSLPPEVATHPDGDGLPPAYAAMADRRFSSLTIPRPPTRVAAEAEDGFAYVTWIPSCQDGGAPVLYFTVSASTGAVKVVPAEEFLAKGYVSFEDLENGHGITFAVSAANRIGSSRPSPPTTNVSPTHKRKLKAPAAPALVSLKVEKEGTAVEITPSASDGGSPVIAFALSPSVPSGRILLEGLDVVHSDVAHAMVRFLRGWSPMPGSTVAVTSISAGGESQPLVVAVKR